MFPLATRMPTGSKCEQAPPRPAKAHGRTGNSRRTENYRALSFPRNTQVWAPEVPPLRVVRSRPRNARSSANDGPPVAIIEPIGVPKPHYRHAPSTICNPREYIDRVPSEAGAAMSYLVVPRYAPKPHARLGAALPNCPFPPDVLSINRAFASCPPSPWPTLIQETAAIGLLPARRTPPDEAPAKPSGKRGSFSAFLRGRQLHRPATSGPPDFPQCTKASLGTRLGTPWEVDPHFPAQRLA